MTMGPAPMIMIDLMSVLFGIAPAPVPQIVGGYRQARPGRKSRWRVQARARRAAAKTPTRTTAQAAHIIQV